MNPVYFSIHLLYEVDEVLSKYVADWAWSCQEPQCFWPVGMARPSPGQVQEPQRPSTDVTKDWLLAKTSVCRVINHSCSSGITAIWSCSPTETSYRLARPSHPCSTFYDKPASLLSDIKYPWVSRPLVGLHHSAPHILLLWDYLCVCLFVLSSFSHLPSQDRSKAVQVTTTYQGWKTDYIHTYIRIGFFK